MIDEVVQIMIKLGVQNITIAGIYAEKLKDGRIKIVITPGGTQTVIRREDEI